jgi:hypothetical protein
MSKESQTEQQVSPENGRIRCAIYARTATAPARESIERQIQVCREEAAKLGWEVLEAFIAVDEGRSGDTVAETEFGSEDASFRFALAQQALADEIRRWSLMPKDMKCACVGCELFRVPVQDPILT